MVFSPPNPHILERPQFRPKHSRPPRCSRSRPLAPRLRPAPARRPPGADDGPELDFLGEASSELYGLPQTQQAGIFWPGWNTQGVDYAQLAGPVTLHLVPVEVPDGATKGTTIDIDFATHAHANWVFTDPRVYGFDVYYSAPLPEVGKQADGVRATGNDGAAGTGGGRPDAAPPSALTPLPNPPP